MSNPQSQVIYRVAERSDCDTVIQMLCELVDELGVDEESEQIKRMLHDDIRSAYENPNIRIFLAELDGSPIGLGRADILTTDPIFRLREDHRCGYIDQMYVRNAYRDRGIGAHLLRLCEQWFRDQGIAHCILHAAPKAVRFYARIGYQPNREMFKRL